jgi:hypothetical protein
MLHLAVLFGSLLFLLANTGEAFCQTVPACRPTFPPLCNRLDSRAAAAAVTRTVQVDVPVPCPANRSAAPVMLPPQPGRGPVCSPPCPTQPVQVRIDVRVRPEAPKSCPVVRFCCENPPVFEPIFCRAAQIVRSAIVAPLGLGECFLGHGIPRPPCPPPIPISCQPFHSVSHSRLVNACSFPTFQSNPPRPPLVRSPLPGPPSAVGAQPVCGPYPAWTHPGSGPLPR